VNGLESGASHRIQAIKNILGDRGFETEIVSRAAASHYLGKNWDAIVLASFSTVKISRRARNVTSFLWFDPTDSWSQTRKSLIRQGKYLQIFAYLRDLYFIWTAPRFELITFITSRDRQLERAWWRWRVKPLVFPVSHLDRTVRNSSRTRLVFVGDGHYPPNQQAFKFLVKLVAKLPQDLPIHIFGRGYDFTHSGFIFHGYSSSNELYSANDIHLAPVFSGAGLKLKVAIPLWNGLRVVTTPEGANGFNLHAQLSIGKTPIEFLEKIQCFLNEPLGAPPTKLREAIFIEDETELIKSRIEELKKPENS
jgi:Glycosyl transferases group 1